PRLAAAMGVLPVVGGCYQYSLEIVATRPAYGSNPVPCTTGNQLTEVAYVGMFTGKDAEQSAPPGERTSGRKAVYDQCQQGASAYLGGDWHLATVALIVVVPADASWQGGARWFRCDLAVIATPVDRIADRRTAAKDGLTGDRPLAISCLTTKEDGSNHILD